jgi:RNA polymerase sigma factor (sigma-70 family)
VKESEVAELVQRARSGDNRAFDELFGLARVPLTFYVRRFVNHRHNIEDILQETFLHAYVAIRHDQYQHINCAALAGWLRRIAWHVLIHRQGPEAEEGSEALANVAAAGGVAEEVGAARLMQFLDRQFDEVLIEAEGTEEGRGLGLLKKMAFLRFYLDGLSQRETVAAVLHYAARIGIEARIDRVTVNNWIARGDILRQVVRHLVNQHREVLEKLTDPEKVGAKLDAREKRMLDLHWGEGQSVEAIAEEIKIAPDQVQAWLRAAKRKVAEGLFRIIKKELHDLRYEDRRRGCAGPV